MSKVVVISERTYDEWPSDHPLKQASVLPDEHLGTADVVVCTIKGEPRHPPALGDRDVESVCHRCGIGVMHRASAPDLPKECWRCFLVT